MSNVPVAKLGAIGLQNSPLVDRDLGGRGRFFCGRRGGSSEDVLVEDMKDKIIEMVEISQSIPP